MLSEWWSKLNVPLPDAVLEVNLACFGRLCLHVSCLYTE